MKTTTPPVRNSISHSSRDCHPVAGLLIPLLLVCFALLPRAQAVLPAPDGGYPGGNTAEGTNALLSRTSGVYNTATGLSALLKDTTGSRNTANGVSALRFNTTGSSNTAIGTNALLVNTTDNFNTAVGDSALFSNATGSDNTAAGYQALRNNTTGDANTAIGDDALLQNTSGFGNTALGFQAGFSVQTANNVICIGHSGSNVSNSCWINNIYSNVQPVVGTNPDYVTITNTGRLGRGGVSSRRYKHDIKPMDKASEVLFALKSVSFRYNKQYDATQTIAFGLIAEEVAEVYPDLVGR